MFFRAVIVLSACAIAAPADAWSQIRASERASVSQTIDGTIVTIEYARPQIRGRENVFSRVVRLGETWTPGANWATTLEVNRPIRLNDREVPAGKYSVWMVPAEGEWKINLHQNPRLFHTQHPKAEEMFLSFGVTPEAGQPLMEVLTFDFPRVGRDGATLRLRWADVALPLDIKIQPSRAAVVMNPDQLAPYLGSYTLTAEVEAGKTVEMKMELIDAKGVLRGVGDGAWGPFTMEFIPTKTPHQFLPALVDKGQVADVEENPVIFEMEGNKAIGFKVMGIGQNVWMRGKRKS